MRKYCKGHDCRVSIVLGFMYIASESNKGGGSCGVRL